MSVAKIVSLLILTGLSVLAGLFVANVSPFMTLSGRTTQPIGHYEFCLKNSSECSRNSSSDSPLSLSKEWWTTIHEVNAIVNTMVRPLNDIAMWGKEEVWSYPVGGMGDCEDYVLEKRRMLLSKGLSASQLLSTVVRQTNGAGHAVLTVRTSAGDLILDNLETRVLAWSDTDYQFLKRQSERHAGIWLAIEHSTDIPVGSLRR